MITQIRLSKPKHIYSRLHGINFLQLMLNVLYVHVSICQLLHGFRLPVDYPTASIVFQLLADGVIPNEYGINPKQKLKIGSKVNVFNVVFCWYWSILLFLVKGYKCAIDLFKKKIEFAEEDSSLLHHFQTSKLLLMDYCLKKSSNSYCGR